VEGGGCSGFQYEFLLEEEGPGLGDHVFSVHGATVICDDVSLEFLKGSVVDFESDLMRSAFVVRWWWAEIRVNISSLSHTQSHILFS